MCDHVCIQCVVSPGSTQTELLGLLKCDLRFSLFTDNERFVNCVALETIVDNNVSKSKIYDQDQHTDIGTKFDKLKHMRVTNNLFKDNNFFCIVC